MFSKIIFTLYVVAMFLIIIGNLEIIVSAMMGLLLIIILFVITYNENSSKRIEKNVKRDKILIINRIGDKMENFASGISDINQNLNKSMFSIEQRIGEIKRTHDIEEEKNYRELARKIFDVENKLNDMRRTLGAAYGSLDDRMKILEEDKKSL